MQEAIPVQPEARKAKQTPAQEVEQTVAAIRESGDVVQQGMGAIEIAVANGIAGSSNGRISKEISLRLMPDIRKLATEFSYQGTTDKIFSGDAALNTSTTLGLIDTIVGGADFLTPDERTVIASRAKKELTRIHTTAYLDQPGTTEKYLSTIPDEPTKRFVREAINSHTANVARRIGERLADGTLTVAQARKEATGYKNTDIRQAINAVIDTSPALKTDETKKVRNTEGIIDDQGNIDATTLSDAIKKTTAYKDADLFSKSEITQGISDIEENKTQTDAEITKRQTRKEKALAVETSEVNRAKMKERLKWGLKAGVPLAVLLLLAGGGAGACFGAGTTASILGGAALGGVVGFGGGMVAGSLAADKFSNKIKKLDVQQLDAEISSLKQNRTIIELRKAAKQNDRAAFKTILESANLSQV